MKKITAAAAILLIFCMIFNTAADGSEYRDIPAVMYHHMLKDPARNGKYVVSPDEFESDLRYLKEKGYESVTASQVLAYCDGTGDLPPKPIMITFDDGQESFRAYALPLLEKYGMCAVLSVVGSYADEYTESGDHNVNYSYLTWPELKEISCGGDVELAIHTYDMHSLGARKGCGVMAGESNGEYRAAFTSDVEAAEQRFHDYLGMESVSVFTFPFGARCPQAEEILKGRGYRLFLTCEEYSAHVERGGGGEVFVGRYNRPGGAKSSEFFAGMGVI